MRLIDADEMSANETEAYLTTLHKCDKINRDINYVVHTKIQKLIADTPTVDAIPVAHGKWIGYETNSFKNSYEGIKRKFYRCSVCRTANVIRANYCPNCGAKMDGK